MILRLLLATHVTRTAQAFRQSALEVGAEVQAFKDLTAATRAARDERFDAIFVDAALPGFIRGEFVTFARKTKFNSQAPVVLLTGYAALARASRTPPAGAPVLLRPTAEELGPFLKELQRKLRGERRKHRRLSFRTSVTCAQGMRRFHVTSTNLSSVGMLLDGASSLARGEEFEVRFLLAPEEPPFLARARVVRREGQSRAGIAFQNLEGGARLRLQRFLDAHLPSSR